MELSPSPTRVVWGMSLADALPEQLDKLGAQACFIMVSRTLRRSSPEVRQAITALGPRCCGVYDGMRPHAPREDVLAAARAAREAAADLVVTIGGGSLTDAGKCVCLLLEHREVLTVADFRLYRNRGSFKSPPHYEHTGEVRQIAVPTTLSGGEFTRISGVTNLAIPRKESFVHPLLQPVVVIFDPQITVYTPEWLWLSTGVRAVDHCVEGLCSIAANSYSDAQAQAALGLLVPALRRVRRDSRDLAARLDCQIGCMIAASLVQMGIDLGASHAIGHSLGGAADVPHGYTSCVMLPAVIRYNAEHCAAKLELVSSFFAHRGVHASEAVGHFVEELGMPRSLCEVGVSAEQFATIAEHALGDPWMKTNPRPVEDARDVIEILQMARGIDSRL